MGRVALPMGTWAMLNSPTSPRKVNEYGDGEPAGDAEAADGVYGVSEPAGLHEYSGVTPRCKGSGGDTDGLFFPGGSDNVEIRIVFQQGCYPVDTDVGDEDY